VEVSALKTTVPATALRGPSPLLRLQSDERLIALTRRGQHAAFEVLFSRYHARLLSFCRHMLGSREDAEDVLQEVFAAAFNAVLADQRAINVRPWLYRIARNRSLNHLRRASAIGVDSMDVHYADQGLSTGDQVMRRESFRQLIGDVQQLPETQRTALLLREIDALSYDQIALAMETTVPSVKSLLVRARISLAEAAEARKLSCDEVRIELGEVAEGLVKVSPPARRHLRDCERCRSFRKHLKDNNHALAAVLPVGALLMFKKILLAKLGSAGSAHVAGGAGATVGAGAAAAGGAGATGGIFTLGAGALATKAVAGLAAAAIVGAGAVAADQSNHRRAHAHRLATAAVSERPASEPLVVAERTQPVSSVVSRPHPALAAVHRHTTPHRATVTAIPAKATPAAPVAPVAAVVPAKPATPAPTEPQVTQVTAESTQLPTSATANGQPASATTAPATAPTPTTPASSPPPPPTVPSTTPTTTVTTTVTSGPTPPTGTPTGPATEGSGEKTTPTPPDTPQVAPGAAQEASASTSAVALPAPASHRVGHWPARRFGARSRPAVG
jgi:RNA polymerase sigma factor (sigma-70 family)